MSVKDTTEQFAIPRSDTINKGAELELLKILAFPIARLLAGTVSSEIEVLGVQEKPAP